MCVTAEYLSGADLTVPLQLELPLTLFLSHTLPRFPISLHLHLDNSQSECEMCVCVCVCACVRAEYFSETQMFLYDLIIDIV